MEAIISPNIISSISDFINIAKKDSKAEVECRLLAGKIQLKNVADRILRAIQTVAIGPEQQSYRLTFTYPDSTRVGIDGSQYIHKVISTNSFKEVPLTVERKNRYYEGLTGKVDIIDVTEASARFTLKSETPLRKDWEGNPNDPKAHVRMINRKSFKTSNDLFRIDFSMVKTRMMNSRQTLRDMIQQPQTYELEIEFINKNTKIDNTVIVSELLKILTTLSQAYYQSPFLLSVSDMERYIQEFKMSSNTFYNPVTLVRRELNSENPHTITKGYTVTNKADGERSGLYVAQDKKVIKITPNFQVTWTGLTANDNSHHGDFIDGEYIPDKQLFCIFDVYRYRNRDVKNLPLMKNEEDTLKNPTNSRLGCARLFIEELNKNFTMSPSMTPIRIETKMFLAGDGATMEEAIRTILTTEFEYEIDGLIFTPRLSPVAPVEDRKGKTWLRVYKWKPPQQNTIDFLIKFSNEETFDPVLMTKAKKGSLFVSKSSTDDIVYPRETMTGEYIPPKLPEDLQRVANSNTRVPAIFQPNVPRDPDAYAILIPMNESGITVDKDGNRVDDNTIVECSFDIDSRRWTILRTRYDKTFQYRVLKEPQYGNDISTANSVWTSMHVPVTEDMIKSFVSNPPDSTYEDDMYYRDDLKRSTRVFNDVYDFHNRIKDELYKENIKKGDTLLELASGRAGDLNKWKRVKPSKVVAIDISLANITSPTQGAAVRYIMDKRKHPRDFIPPVLFIQGDMSYYPLFEQEDKYMPILTGEETATTEYLTQFQGLSQFDCISCQFALHYACESEEIFRAFAKNLQKYGKGIFFGTCSDGQSIYSLLVGKRTHLFGNGKQISGEYTKEYMDKDSWTEEFGMPVKVLLESFDKPAIEYLVPFEKVTEILDEHGYELVETKMFSEIYSSQTALTLTPEQQTFSFLNRTFIFKRKAEPEVEELEKKEEKEPEPELKIEESEKKEEKEKEPEPEKKEERNPVKTKKLKKKEEQPEEEPVLFFGADESKGEYRNFSNMSDHPIEIDGETYKSVEHYFQAMKAKQFEDTEIYTKIVNAKTTKAAKALGKKVKNFSKEVWDSKRDEVMEHGVKAKFVQHPELRKQLLETNTKIIGEADARNTYWGIGTSISSDKSKKPSKWRGQNKLGKILMSLRTMFREQDSI